MLTYKLLKNNAGVMLMGDYQTLKSFYSVIHEINDNCPVIKDKEGLLLTMAYDIRKAFEGQRAKIKPPEGYPEIGPRFGVEALWPVLLVQSRMMRVYMGFMPTTKHQQAHAYAFEAVVEGALEEAFTTDASNLIEEWSRIDPAHPWPEQKIRSRAAIFCSWSKAERRKMLLGLLASLNPMYPFFYRTWTRNGVGNLLSPEDLDAWHEAEWVDPRW